MRARGAPCAAAASDRWRATLLQEITGLWSAHSRGVTRQICRRRRRSSPDTTTNAIFLNSYNSLSPFICCEIASWYCYRAENRISRVDQIELRIKNGHLRVPFMLAESSSARFPSHRGAEKKRVGLETAFWTPFSWKYTLSSAKQVDKLLFCYI